MGTSRLAATVILAVMGTVALTAMPASDLQNMQVTRHIFSTQLLTMTGHMRTNQPDAYRFLILRCEGTRPTADETRIFASDFVLDYVFRGEDGQLQEQRAKIEAIATAGEGWDFGAFLHGTEPQTLVSGNQVAFSLAALVENNVQQITLRRAGTNEAITVDLAQDQPRRYSIYVTSIGQQSVSEKLCQALIGQGFDARPSAALSEDTTGCTVKYGKGLAAAAEEVRATIKQTLGRDATIEQLDDSRDVCEYDLLVWLGR